MNVRKMNGKKPENQDSYKSLLLLDEISKGENLSQRGLSRKLNIALGLVNSYINNLISKGYITIKNIPSKRYAYYLTSQGFAEKSRLTYKHLQNFTNLYKIARKDFRNLFRRLEKDNIKSIVFCGVDEVTEIAFISLQEFDIELIAVFDNERQNRKFFNFTVRPLLDVRTISFDNVVITSFLRKNEFYSELLEIGIPNDKILFNKEVL
ncbi:MAG: winged helix-turn-helix transcriptional regulator [Nitrospirota bacterium]